jgi:hypothetical protein
MLIAEKVFGYQVEVVKPEWYKFEVYLFKDVERDCYLYSLDENACNAMMYRNGVDARDGTLPPLPFYSIADSTDFTYLHEPMLIQHSARIHYYCNPRGGKVVYGAEIIRTPKPLPKICYGEESEDMAEALCLSIKRFFEIIEWESAVADRGED